jgi:hypothetical protein
MHPTKEQKSWCRCVWYKFGRDRGAGIQISGHRSKFLIIKSLNSLRRAHFHVHDMVFDCATASALTLCCHWLAADALCGVCSSYQPRIIAQLLYTRGMSRAECVGYVSPNIVSVPGRKKIEIGSFRGEWHLKAWCAHHQMFSISTSPEQMMHRLSLGGWMWNENSYFVLLSLWNQLSFWE